MRVNLWTKAVRIMDIAALCLALLSAGLSWTGWYVEAWFTDVGPAYDRVISSLFFKGTGEVRVIDNYELYTVPEREGAVLNKPIVGIWTDAYWNDNPERQIVTMFRDKDRELTLGVGINQSFSENMARGEFVICGIYRTKHRPGWLGLRYDEAAIQEYLRHPDSLLHALAAGSPEMLDHLVRLATIRLVQQFKLVRKQVLRKSSRIAACLFSLMFLDVGLLLLWERRRRREFFVGRAFGAYWRGLMPWDIKNEMEAELRAAERAREAEETRQRLVRAEHERIADELFAEAMRLSNWLDIDAVRLDLLDPTKFEEVRKRLADVRAEKDRSEREAAWCTKAELMGPGVLHAMHHLLKLRVEHRHITPEHLLREARELQDLVYRYNALDEMYAEPIFTSLNELCAMIGEAGFERAVRLVLRELVIQEGGQEAHNRRQRELERSAARG